MLKKIFLLSILIAAQLNIGINQSFARLGLPEDLRPTNAPTITIANGNEASYGNFILQLIAGSLLYLAGPLAILFIVWGGSTYISSHGKQEVMEKAKKTITYAIIGLLAVVFSYIIIQAVIRFALQAS